MTALLLALLACGVDAPHDLPSDAAGELGVVAAATSTDLDVWTQRDGSARFPVVVAQRGNGEPFVLLSEMGTPDRLALSEDQSHLAFVSGVTGLASVWVVEVREGAVPVQVSNRGLELVARTPGHPPSGWQPPPLDDSLTFDGDLLTWNTLVGPEQGSWR